MMTQVVWSHARLLLTGALLALLFAQAVALGNEHLDSHADEVGCELCLAVQGLGAALPASAALPAVPATTARPAFRLPATVLPGRTAPWQARAPPTSPERFTA